MCYTETNLISSDMHHVIPWFSQRSVDAATIPPFPGAVTALGTVASCSLISTW